MDGGDLLNQFMDALRVLPGVGQRTAQRMALHLLERDRDGGKRLAQLMQEAMENIGRCRVCRNLTEREICHLCSNTRRDGQRLCVVESPSDVLAIEHAGIFTGRYFVLLGRLSPLDGIGPDDLGLDELERRLKADEIQELIIATNPTVEGEATAYYLRDIAEQHQVTVTRIAHGVPLGGELEHTDQSTLALAFSHRSKFTDE